MNRKQYNLKILDVLKRYFERDEDVRFGQALYNLNICYNDKDTLVTDGNPWRDIYNDESNDILIRSLKALKKVGVKSNDITIKEDLVVTKNSKRYDLQERQTVALESILDNISITGLRRASTDPNADIIIQVPDDMDLEMLKEFDLVEIGGKPANPDQKYKFVKK